MWLLALGMIFKDSTDKKTKMAEELQKYKDILKREWEEFKKQLVREVSTSKFLLF